MKRLIWLIAVVLLLGTLLAPVSAQNPVWEAWMYNSDNGRMVRVGSDGIVLADITLPGLQGHQYPYAVSISADGNLVAYALNNSFNGSITIYVFNVLTNQLIVTYTIPSAQGDMVFASMNYVTTSQIFAPDQTTILIGYSIELDWTLLAIDLVATPGQVLWQIQSTDPIASTVEKMGFDAPTVIRYDGQVVDFVIIPGATEGLPHYPHYTYTLGTNTLVRNYYFTVPGGDFYNVDGRYVFNTSDFRLPNNRNNYQGFGEQINALHMWIPGTTETYPIFNAPNHSIHSPEFIQNAEKIIVLANELVGASSAWWVIDQVTGQQSASLFFGDLFPTGIEGVGDGVLASFTTNDLFTVYPALQSSPNRSILLSMDTRASADGSAAQQIWISGENQNFRLVWARDNLAATRPPAGTWASIGQPVNASNFADLNPPPTSPPVPPPSAGLQIGGQASIFTTEGDRANMRSGAGTEFAIVSRLANNTIVTVLDGPVASGGFTWWQVQVDQGSSGWVVESADGVKVLQSLGSPSSPVSQSSNIPASILAGGNVVVSASGNNLNARRQANTTAPVVSILQTGDILPVIGGPVIGEGFTWWQVSTSEGIAWVAEGNGVDRWIVPAASG